MTIGQNSNYVLEHPYTKRAVEEFLSGDIKSLKFLLDMLQLDMYQEVSTLCARAYRTNKKENYPTIEEAIREVAPPERLSIKLPIPLPKTACIVVPMQVKHVKRVHKAIAVIGQLELVFPIKKATPERIAL